MLREALPLACNKYIDIGEILMNDIGLVLLGLFFGILFIYVIASIIQNRVNKTGYIFTPNPSPALRILAFVFGLLFGGVFLVDLLTSDRFLVIMPVLSFVLLAYSLGATKVLNSLQGSDKTDKQ
jgi:hypothetical protein